MSRRRKTTADIFETPTHAVIDIGSNTVRLVIFGGPARAPIQIWNEKVTARLGKGLADDGKLAKDSVAVALDGLARFVALLKCMKIDDVETVATAAVRDASNGQKFLEQVRALGLDPRLLSGEEEARAAALGVISGFPEADGVVADLGGGSLELTQIGPSGIKAAASFPLGTLRLAAIQKRGPDVFAHQVIDALKVGDWDTKLGKPLYLVGGTFRSMANFELQSENSVLDDPHGLVLDHDRAYRLAKLISRTSPDDLKRFDGISSMRASVLPQAAGLLRILLAELAPQTVVFSSLGLREGLLYQRLDPAAQKLDPLLSGIAAFATPRGGPPALAARIASWTIAASKRNGAGNERLRLASIMLALASMPVEPNLRLRESMDWALHKRWLDLTAEGRALIAAALSANCGEMVMPVELVGLAEDAALQEAQCWGLAFRLCRRIGANSPASIEGTVLCREGGLLKLLFAESLAALRCKSTDKDLANLAGMLGLEPQIEIVPDDDLPQRRFAALDHHDMSEIGTFSAQDAA